MRGFLTVILLLGLSLVAGSAAAEPPVAGTKTAPTGTEVGAEVSFFYARAITGPDAGKTVCYVCKYQERPVVMVFVRKLEDGLEEFLQRLDQEVDKQRRQSLRACVLFCGQEPAKLQPKLVTLAHDLQLTLPLAIPAEYQTGPASLQLDPDAAVTVVLYKDRKVMQTHKLAPGKLSVARAKELVPQLSKALLP